MQFSKREKGGRRGLAWLETAAALTVPAPAPEGAALRSSLRAAVEQLVHSLAQLSRAEGSTGSARFTSVFLPKAFTSRAFTSAGTPCTKERGGKEEKPRTIKIYFCFFFLKQK